MPKVTRLMVCPECAGAGEVESEYPVAIITLPCASCRPGWLRIGAEVRIRGRVNPGGKVEKNDGNEPYLGRSGIVVEEDPGDLQGNRWIVAFGGEAPQRVRFRPWEMERVEEE